MNVAKSFSGVGAPTLLRYVVKLNEDVCSMFSKMFCTDCVSDRRVRPDTEMASMAVDTLGNCLRSAILLVFTNASN